MKEFERYDRLKETVKMWCFCQPLFALLGLAPYLIARLFFPPKDLFAIAGIASLVIWSGSALLMRLHYFPCRKRDAKMPLLLSLIIIVVLTHFALFITSRTIQMNENANIVPFILLLVSVFLSPLMIMYASFKLNDKGQSFQDLFLYRDPFKGLKQNFVLAPLFGILSYALIASLPENIDNWIDYFLFAPLQLSLSLITIPLIILLSIERK